MKKIMTNLALIAQNTQSDNIKMIDIDELHESEDNFFVVERISEFAETILGQGGIKDNLIVRPLREGGYEIISGHRRTAAIRYLLEHGESISRFLPCLIQEYADEDSKMLDLILMNVSARQLSDTEMWNCYNQLNAILERKKEKGEHFGRIRETIGNTLGISPAQVGKMQNIERNAIDEIKEAVQNGDLSISTASEIAKMDESEQEELAKGGKLEEVKHKDVKKKNTESKAAKKKTVPEPVADEPNDFDEVIESDEEVDTYINSDGSDEEDDICINPDDSDKKVDICINSESNEPENDADEDAAQTVALKIITGISSMEADIIAKCNLSKSEFLAGIKFLEDISKDW